MKKLTALDVLKKARKLISNRENWIKGYSARDREGNCTSSAGAKAYSFCSTGALWAVVKNQNEDLYYEPRNLLQSEIRKLPKQHYYSVVDFNDDPKTTHKQVLSIFDRAIKRLEKQKAK